MNPDIIGMQNLRNLVEYFDLCRESFLEQFTMQELIALYDAQMRCEWDVFPDHWTEKQVKQALRGIAPQFRYRTENERHGFGVRQPEIVEGLVPVYPKRVRKAAK